MDTRASVSLLNHGRAWIGDIVRASGDGGEEYVVLENHKANSYTVRSKDGHVPQNEQTIEHSDLQVKKDDWLAVEEEQQCDIPPSWAYSDNVADIAFDYSRSHGGALSLRNVAGGAIPYVFVIMLMLWSFYPVFFVITLNSAVCNDNGFSTYPLRIWFVFAPIVLGCYCLEFAAFRIAFVPFYQVLNKDIFLLFGRPLGFRLWFFKASCQSLLAYFAFATNGAFAGTAIATMDRARECNRNFVDNLHEKWEEMMETALFGIWQKIDWIPTFQHVIFFALSFQALKLVMALCQTVPYAVEGSATGCCGVHYEFVLDSRSNEEGSSRKKAVEYRTCFHRKGVGGALQNHGAALMALANANGLNTIFDCETKYASERTKIDWEKYANEQAKIDWEKNKLKIVAHPEGQLNRALTQLSEAILGSGLLLNIKTTMWALVGSVTKTQLLREREGALQAFYIIVGAITCGLNLLRMYKTIIFVKKWIGPSAGDHRVDAGGFNVLVIRLWFVQFLACVFAIEICYAVGKLVCGIAFCPLDAQMFNLFAWQHCV